MYLPLKHELKKNQDTEGKYVGTTLISNKCILFDNQLRFFKCNRCKSLDPATNWVWQKRKTYVSTAWRVAIKHSLGNHETVVSNKIVQRKIAEENQAN